MIEFNYEYEVIDTHDLGIYGLKERLEPYGKAGWIVNCSVGDFLILSRLDMKYTAPEGIMSKQEVFEKVC